METESNRPITRQLYHQTYISYPLEITFVCHLIQPYMDKSFARHSELESETLVLETKMITISPMTYLLRSRGESNPLC